MAIEDWYGVLFLLAVVEVLAAAFALGFAVRFLVGLFRLGWRKAEKYRPGWLP